ncbi:MAG: sigma-70 family RNA polymerase sigma factor [Thermoanaerobaculia bacterium]
MKRSQDATGAERRAAFEAEALPHLERLHRAARRLVRRPEEAADLVQETYLRAYRTFDGFTPGTNSRAWLFTILYSVFINIYHRQRRAPREASLSELEERFDRVLAAPGWDAPLLALEPAGAWGTSAEVTAALLALPAEFRAAVVLVDLGELSYEEAGAAMSCPLGTVRSRLARGRKLLAARLHDYAVRLGYPAPGS